MKIFNSGLNKSLFYKGIMPVPLSNPLSFHDQFLNAVKNNGNDIFYPKCSKFNPPRSDPGFSIIIKGSSYDIDPVVPLKL